MDRGGGGVCAASEGDRRGAYRDAVFAIVDASAVGENMDVCAFGAEFAVSLEIEWNWSVVVGLERVGFGRVLGGRTFAKYLHTVSAAAPISWLKGQALPAWQAPCRKNLQGTCDVSVECH